MREGGGSGGIDARELWWLMMWWLLIIDVTHVLDLQRSLDFKNKWPLRRARSEPISGQIRIMVN